LRRAPRQVIAKRFKGIQAGAGLLSLPGLQQRIMPTRPGVERGAESLGEEIAADEQRYTEPLAETPLPPTLYMGLASQCAPSN